MMKKSTSLSIILLLTTAIHLSAQTFYVDPVKGSDEANGGPSTPLASLEKAADLAGNVKDNEPVTIILAPGLYRLTRQLKIESRKGRSDTAKYTLKAMVMPDDSTWAPVKMPVIQSVSGNNSTKNFIHAVGFEICRDNVCIEGLKFVGNANPGVDYYYCIVRDSSGLHNLDISQCYFLGDKNWAMVQGAIYTEGAGVHVDHCIFFGCKHDVLLFQNIYDFSLTHSIIYGSYGAAVWFGDLQNPDHPFIFRDNIVANCNYFWGASGPGSHPLFKFSNSLITDIGHFMATTNTGYLVPFEGDDGHTEINIRKTGKVILNEVTIKGMPHDFLQLATNSDGRDIDAGIYRKKAS